MNLRSWGNYPTCDGQALKFDDLDQLRTMLREHNALIAYGNGRSYGDSALSRAMVQMRPRDLFLHFDDQLGVLHVQSGVLLADIIRSIVPKGWFLQVVPGTKLITVGGAIASDVHGKNHHQAGCFSQFLVDFRLMLPNGDIVTCSATEHSDLFHATCGGMGLTGIVLDARIRLKRIGAKTIGQTTIKTANLRETFEAFEQYADSPYSVAWIDCLAKGADIGRCLLRVGDFLPKGKLDYKSSSKPAVPFSLPGFALNTLSVKSFNWLYYGKVKAAVSEQKVSIDSFFFPLDAVGHWNRIYGKNGFTQYQFILPKEASFEGLSVILKTIADSGKGSFLAVLKLYGPANENYLSFPLEGYSLALDFKIEPGLFTLLDKLDEIVLAHGGRIYLAKDARVSRQVFEQGYPDVDKFRALRCKYQMDKTFHSMQSKRLEL